MRELINKALALGIAKISKSTFYCGGYISKTEFTGAKAYVGFHEIRFIFTLTNAKYGDKSEVEVIVDCFSDGTFEVSTYDND